MELFSINSKVRDYDIILEMLSEYTSGEVLRQSMNSNHHHNPHEQSSNILKSLETLRNRELTESKTLAVELRKLSVPKLGITILIYLKKS